MAIFSTFWHISSHLSYFICPFQKYYLSFLSNRVYEQQQTLYSLLKVWSTLPFSDFIISISGRLPETLWLGVLKQNPVKNNTDT